MLPLLTWKHAYVQSHTMEGPNLTFDCSEPGLHGNIKHAEGTKGNNWGGGSILSNLLITHVGLGMHASQCQKSNLCFSSGALVCEYLSFSNELGPVKEVTVRTDRLPGTLT